MLKIKKVAPKDAKIEKPEDREWNRWFNGLDNKEHERKLAMLGLDKEDIDEWENHTVFQALEQEANAPEQAPARKTNSAKAKR